MDRPGLLSHDGHHRPSCSGRTLARTDRAIAYKENNVRPGLGELCCSRKLFVVS